MFNPDFNLQMWLSGVKKNYVNEDQKVSVIHDLFIYVFIASVFLLAIIFAMGVKLFSKKPEFKDII